MKLERKCLIVFSTILLVICFVAITKTYGTVYTCSKPESNGTKCEPFSGKNWELVNGVCIGTWVVSGCEKSSKRCGSSLTKMCEDMYNPCTGDYEWRDVDEYYYAGEWTCVAVGDSSYSSCSGTYLWAQDYP